MNNNLNIYLKLKVKISMVFLGLLFFSSVSQSQESVYLKIPFMIEDDIILSDLVFETQASALNESFLQLQGRQKNSSELAYFDLLNAIRTEDVESISRYFYREPFSDQAEGAEIGRAYAEALSNEIENSNTIRSYAVGSETWFIIQIDLEGEPARRIFSIMDENALNGDNFWRFSQPTGDSALLNVVAEAEQLEMQGQQIFVDAAFVEGLQHEKLLTNGNSKWHFNGFTAKFDAFEQNPQIPENDVAIFYHQAMNALKTGFPEAITGFYTPQSSQKYSDWVVEQGPQAYRAYVDDMLQQERKVEFILDANPVYLVFFKTSDGQMPYDVVFRNADGDLKLTNFYMEGLIDDILKDREYFVSHVIEPLVASSPNTAQSQETNESNVTSNTNTSSQNVSDETQNTSVLVDTNSQTNQISELKTDKESANRSSLWIMLIAAVIVIFVLVVLMIKNKKS